jgi:hypothetical protein
MLTRNIVRHSVALAVLGFVTTVGSAQAATYTFTDPGWVSGSVNTSTGEIILTALASNPTDVSQTISGIEITFTTALGSTSLTSQASTNGLLDTFTITPPSTRSVTQAAGTPTNWVLGVVGDVLTLSSNNSCTGAPCDFIVGPAPYTNFNSSFNSHNPFIDLEGKFVVSGITDLLISSIVVQFGSVPGERNQTFACLTCAPPPPGETPIPGALPLFTSGMGVLGFLGWRRKRRLARQAA